MLLEQINSKSNMRPAYARVVGQQGSRGRIWRRSSKLRGATQSRMGDNPNKP